MSAAEVEEEEEYEYTYDEEPEPMTASKDPVAMVYDQSIRQHIVKDMVMHNEEGEYAHAYNVEIGLDKGIAPERRKRLNKEMKDLAKNLSVHFSSSIAVRFDRKRNYVIKAIIFAPPNTPYDSGAFLFDIYVPPEYPKVPPKVCIMTTANGKVRFSPNLYANGKVCLSLLGTWRGDNPSQNWDPKKSTIWQVLVSIQTAILGSECPVYDEPGVIPRKDKEVRLNIERHSKNGGILFIRPSTMRYAVVDMINCPPPGFREVILLHFSHKYEYILGVYNSWVVDAGEDDKYGTKDAYDLVVMTLNVLMAKFSYLKSEEQEY